MSSSIFNRGRIAVTGAEKLFKVLHTPLLLNFLVGNNII